MSDQEASRVEFGLEEDPGPPQPPQAPETRGESPIPQDDLDQDNIEQGYNFFSRLMFVNVLSIIKRFYRWPGRLTMK